VLDQVRSDMLHGRHIGPIDGIDVDAVFLNHGDMVLPFEWPAAQAKLLVREGRVLAGKHAVVTVHESADPYILRVVAYDTEIGREFVLYLTARDVTLLLDTHDSETTSGQEPHMQGTFVKLFLQCQSLSAALLDVVINSLSFSVWQDQQILVACEMRIPSVKFGQVESRDIVSIGNRRSSIVPVMDVLLETSVEVERKGSRDVKRLYEDVLGFEGKLCLFSLVHTTTPNMCEDILRASVYYPKTCAHVEACLSGPMLSDRLRIVAEAGQLDTEGPFSVVIVVEETVYPPSFLVRLTSVGLNDAFAASSDETRPHTHILRIAKDGSTTMHVPDITFAISPSTIRTKLLRCIGASSQLEGPRDTMLTMPSVTSVTGQKTLVQRKVTGHVNSKGGLRVQLLSNGRPSEQVDIQGVDHTATAMPAAMRAQLRAKYGRGRLLVRQGRKLILRATQQSLRTVVSIYERSQPYYHFVLHAYEPQTSREWEVLVDSIDIYRLFTDREVGRSQLDLANPATQGKIAGVLAECVDLSERDDEIVLTVSPSAVSNHMDRVHGDQKGSLDAGRKRESLEVRAVRSHVHTLAVAGLTDDRAEQLVEQKSSDRLFLMQRRIAAGGQGRGDLYKIQVYDAPLVSTLHSYVVVATPLHDSSLKAAGLPASGDSSEPAPLHHRTYSLKVDDKVLDGFLWDKALLEPSRQEQLLHLVCDSLHLDEDTQGQLRLWLKRKKAKLPVHHVHKYPEAVTSIMERGAVAPAAMHSAVREVGGTFPLKRLQPLTGSPAGPSLRGDEAKIFGNWTKVFNMAQRFGSSTVMISVSKCDRAYKLGVYDPESSTLYEMCLVTSNSTTPMNILLERCDLGRIELGLCMHEVSFPHQLSINIIHLQTSQEFNLKIGDDLVYTMVENSRREAFFVYIDQLLSYGCIGFDIEAGSEEQALANVFEETFAGNQIFERMQIEDTLQFHMNATQDGETSALPPKQPKKIRVPVIRTQLDFLGKRQAQVKGISMQLLYHAEQHLQQDNQALILRVHKKSSTNDVAVTLRVRSAGALALPAMPRSRGVGSTGTLPTPCSAKGRPFDAPALGASEGQEGTSGELTLWVQDKCSRAPCGIYGEICEVPGIDKPLLLLVTDEETPRAMRLVVCLAVMPYSVLFQCVFLEASEADAKVVGAQKGSRHMLQQMFHKYFGGRAPTSHLLSQLTTSPDRDKDLKQRIDELSALEGRKLGIEQGQGAGGPDSRSCGEKSSKVIYMCTRQKLGRMMVFTIFRDLIGQNLYVRVVMHDPVSGKDCHLTLLHYTTQRLFDFLQINRHMIEESYEPNEAEKQQRSDLRSELGKLVVDHIYVQRTGDVHGEEIDHLQFPEEEVDYELKMREIMSVPKSSDLSVKQQLMNTAHDVEAEGSRSLTLAPQSLSARGPNPKTLLDMGEEHLVHKTEKVVHGKRVFIAFYNETTKEDMIQYSHNIRVAVADLSLDILTLQDFHEDTLEPLCARRGKRHLLSATRERDLVRELCESIALQHCGQQVTGITFDG